jgi:CRISPR-associated endonuclease/helicase Cas3
MITIISSDYRRFWGKARPSKQASISFHPVAWHGLDVAAAFLELLKIWPDEAQALAACFEGDWEVAKRALAVLVALHDIGKFAPAFQGKVPACAPSELLPMLTSLSIDHGATGMAYFNDLRFLQPIADVLLAAMQSDDRWIVFQPVFGHHGKPLDGIETKRDRDGHSEGPFVAAAKHCATDVMALYANPVLPPVRKGASASLSWRLAGLIALSDWIGSSEMYFAYTTSDMDMVTYWAHAQRQAAQAMTASGLQGATVSKADPVHAVTQGAFHPTTAQNWAAGVSLDDTAGLFILEDMMGSGKTEAALILAHRLMQTRRASGLYVALPTMATANALYRRLAIIYGRLFEDECQPSLILAHGARDLVDQFRQSIDLEKLGAVLGAITDADIEEDTSTVACARWLADDRRKTFLADVGVGTIDQALLGMLPVKHCAVRQLGMRRRVLIIDEAHAYDAYMQKEIEALIGHQSAMGAPVIILSATLPSAIRTRLIKAWTDARKLPAHQADPEASYPLATVVSTAGVSETKLATRPDLERAMSVMRLADHAAADALVIDAARNGAAVARLCNTVDDAIAAYERLSAQGVNAALFHARFAMGDRLAIEQAALARFGKDSTPHERKGQVLVATQVIEQSLDVDFDLMVSDLAPVDLLLQRAGRVWRHTARTQRGWVEPMLAVVSAEAVPDADKDWYARLFATGQYVYTDHARLWRTAQKLFAQSTVRFPDDMRRLIESVYDDDTTDIPAALMASMVNTMGKDAAKRGHAIQNVLKLREGYAPQGGLWGSDIRTPTRDSDPRTVLRLATITDGKLAPYVSDEDPRRAWSLSEVNVSAKRIAGRGAYAPAIEAQALALEAQWERGGSWAVCMPLSETGNTLIGSARQKEQMPFCISYGKKGGLLFNSRLIT